MSKWSIARESKEWVGPITVTATVDGEPVDIDPASLAFAVLPIQQRPTDTDWTAPVTEPGGTGIGVQADPTEQPGLYGIWARITDSPEIPVLDPSTVGQIYRG